MIIYEGKGYLIPIIVFLSALFTELISEEIMGDKLFYQESTYALPIALFIAGIIIKIVSQKILHKQIEKTGKRIEEKDRLCKFCDANKRLQQLSAEK